MRCQKCGSYNSDKAQFCRRCSTSLSTGINAIEKNKINIFNEIMASNKVKPKEKE